MLKGSWEKHILQFKFDATTSRGTLKTHTTYYIKLYNDEQPDVSGIGEAAPLKGLSIDYLPDFENHLNKFTSNLNSWDDHGLKMFPSIQFALETAILDLKNGGGKKIYNTDFYNRSKPIPINGLVWMADKHTMQQQVIEKLKAGFTTVKLKIGAIDFEDELDLIKNLRSEFSPRDIEIRVDANGAFTFDQAVENLKRLSEFQIHSIEQPIRQGQSDKMAQLCSISPLPVALDEELIGIHYLEDKIPLLAHIRPQYIILKPTLLGGFKASEEWIGAANQLGIGWWATSALESNVGLNAICQFASKFDVTIPQGLGTGNLYQNNIVSPLTVEQGKIKYLKEIAWGDSPSLR